jgi:amidohydrolase
MDELIALGRELEGLAEPGFFERRTHEALAARMRDLGLVVRDHAGMPGFVATTDGSLEGRTLAIVADMDGLPGTGEQSEGRIRYRHLCGHHQQMVAMVAAARGLREAHPRLLEKVAFIATPAEEYVELERREALRASGAVRRLSGKQELIDRGAFKGFRWVVATHSARTADPRGINSVVAMNGFDVLRFTFRGASAHAGAAPHLGRNAQNAACLFLQACAFLRETFDEAKHVRIHPVIRLKPGQTVNLVPDLAFVETYARAVDSRTIDETAGRLIVASQGCAASLGVEAAAERVPGYAPFRVDPGLHESLAGLCKERSLPFEEEAFSAASSDMGDVSRITASIIVGLPGTNGLMHSPDFRVVDEEAAYVLPGTILRDLAARILGA